MIKDSAKRKQIIIFVFSFVFSSLFAREYSLQKRIINIDITENTPVFKTPAYIKVIGKKIFIVDNFGHRVLKYELGKNLRFDTQLGRRGRGPGDLYLPVLLSVNKSKIAIRDQDGISFFDNDKEGVFLKKFRFFSASSSFVYLDDKVYCAVQNPNTQYLIEVYLDNGKKILDIGNKYLDLDKHYRRLDKRLNPFHVENYFYRNLITADEESIYYLDRKFAKIFKYNKKDGIKLLEKNMISLFGKEGSTVLNKNIEILNTKIPIVIKKGIRIKNYPLFNAVHTVNKNIYIFGIEDRIYKKVLNIKVDEYILKIKVLNKDTLDIKDQYTILINHEKDGHVISYDVIENEDRPIFYLAMSGNDGEDYIAEYR